MFRNKDVGKMEKEYLTYKAIEKKIIHLFRCLQQKTNDDLRIMIQDIENDLKHKEPSLIHYGYLHVVKDYIHNYYEKRNFDE